MNGRRCGFFFKRKEKFIFFVMGYFTKKILRDNHSYFLSLFFCGAIYNFSEVCT